MTLMQLACRAALVAGLALSASQPALSQQYVSVQGKMVNVREQPSTRAPVAWELGRGYPLRVTRRQGDWLRVRDHEGDLGWVARRVVGNEPHHVVKARIANLRAQPSARSRVVGKLQQQEIVRTLRKQDGWVHVQRDDGQRGWVARNLLWGW